MVGGNRRESADLVSSAGEAGPTFIKNLKRGWGLGVGGGVDPLLHKGRGKGWASAPLQDLIHSQFSDNLGAKDSEASSKEAHSSCRLCRKLARLAGLPDHSISLAPRRWAWGS